MDSLALLELFLFSYSSLIIILYGENKGWGFLLHHLTDKKTKITLWLKKIPKISFKKIISDWTLAPILLPYLHSHHCHGLMMDVLTQLLTLGLVKRLPLTKGFYIEITVCQCQAWVLGGCTYLCLFSCTSASDMKGRNISGDLSDTRRMKDTEAGAPTLPSVPNLEAGC